MPRIAEVDLERVKRSTDLVALVQSRGVELKKHGSRDWIGRCPFHADGESPNLIVSPEKGLFHCIACGAAGNAIQFVQRHDGVSFRHAFEVLAHGQGFAVGCQEGPIHLNIWPSATGVWAASSSTKSCSTWRRRRPSPTSV